MTKERRMAVTGAGLILLAAAALSVVNYVKGTAYWTLIGVGAGCFVLGVCLYGYTIRDQLRHKLRPDQDRTQQSGRRPDGPKGEE